MNDVILSIKRLIDKKYDAVWTVSNVDSKFHPFKSLIIRNKKLSFFSEMGKKIKYRQQLYLKPTLEMELVTSFQEKLY